jgi:cysteate synthase
MNQLYLPTQYHLASLVTGDSFKDEGWILEASGEEKPSLLSSVYDKVQLEVKDDRYGIYKFGDWLPLVCSCYLSE